MSVYKKKHKFVLHNKTKPFFKLNSYKFLNNVKLPVNELYIGFIFFTMLGQTTSSTNHTQSAHPHRLEMRYKNNTHTSTHTTPKRKTYTHSLNDDGDEFLFNDFVILLFKITHKVLLYMFLLIIIISNYFQILSLSLFISLHNKTLLSKCPIPPPISHTHTIPKSFFVKIVCSSKQLQIWIKARTRFVFVPSFPEHI